MTRGGIDPGADQGQDHRSKVKKRIRGEGRWYGNSIRQQDYQVIMELSGEIPVKVLCKAMGIQRSSFYAWKKHLPSFGKREKEEPCKQCQAVSRIPLGSISRMSCRWLNAQICLDKNIVPCPSPYAHKCCKIAGIKSKSSIHYRY